MPNNIPPIQNFAANLSINRPAPGALVLETGEPREIVVRVTALANDIAVQACVQTAGFLPPIPAPNGVPDPIFFTALTPLGGGVFGGMVRVPPNHACSVTNPSLDNLTVTVIVKRVDNLWDQNPNQTSCKGVCATMVVDVPATACPWFAYADDDLSGPAGEPVRTHKPVRIKIPDGATNVAFTAQGSWRHAPTNPSGPDGNGGDIPLLNPAYRNALYGSDGINAAADFKVNSLVGMFKPVNTIFLIGSALAAQPVNANSALYLGFWDGTQ